MAQVRLGSGLGRIRVPSPERVVKELCGGKRVFLNWSQCFASFMPYTINRDSTADKSDTCMVCTYEYVDVHTQVRIMVE